MRKPSSVTVKTPVRVDVAGGTLDLYPVYNILGYSMTINFAIDLVSKVEIKKINERGVKVDSGDGDQRGFSNSHSIRDKGKLSLLKHALDYFPKADRFSILFDTQAPPGSGLGASSSLIVAILTSFGLFSGHHVPVKNIPQVASEVESSLIQMVTGRQDYVPAIFGGLNVIKFSPGKTQLSNMGKGKNESRFLEKFGFLAYTGISHTSAKENWALVKGLLDGKKKSRKGFNDLLGLSEEALRAISERDPEMLGSVFERESSIRKSLSPKFSVPSLEDFLNKKEVKKSLYSARLCGAGGGGTIFGILRNQDNREKVEKLAVKAGFSPMAFSISKGMEVRVGGKKVGLL